MSDMTARVLIVGLLGSYRFASEDVFLFEGHPRTIQLAFPLFRPWNQLRAKK